MIYLQTRSVFSFRLSDPDSQFHVADEKLSHLLCGTQACPSSQNSDLLWKDLSTYQSQCRDNRDTKTNQPSPDYAHRDTDKPYGFSKASWLQEELQRKGFYLEEKENGGLGLEKVNNGTDKMDVSSKEHHVGPEEEKDEHEPPKYTNQCPKPCPASLVESLRACAKKKDLKKGCQLHDDILQAGVLEKNVFVGSALVNMYAKCGAFEKAREVFEKLPVRDAISWTVLIAGHVKLGQVEDAFICLERMQADGISPDVVTYTSILKACSSTKATTKGQQIHAQIVKYGLLDNDVLLGTALIDMYAKCNLLRKAQEVFDEGGTPDIVSWNVLIAGYAQHRHGEKAMACYEQMLVRGLSPTVSTYVSVLKACSAIGEIRKCQEIHCDVIKNRLGDNIMVANALVDIYGKCGAHDKAQEVFDGLLVRDVVSWNALIAGYTQYELVDEAFERFEQMQREGHVPNAVTFACILKACGSIGAVEKGQEVHMQIEKERLLETNIVVANALVDMYAKCGALAKAQEVFDKLPLKDTVGWNALIAGYVQRGYGEKALHCFKQMQLGGFSPDMVTFVWVFKACGSTGSLEKAEEIHNSVKGRFLEKDIMVANVLVDVYAKGGMLVKARKVFDKMTVRDIVSWTVLTTGYVQHGHNEEALNSFDQMCREGFCPDGFIFSCIMKACGSLGAADKGQRIHVELVRDRLLEKDTIVETALVDFYANCGMLGESQEVFNDLPNKNVVSWNALMAGYAQLGTDMVVFGLFDSMVREGVEPDAVTFTIVLNTCTHGGLLYKCQMLFEVMSIGYGIMPTFEHHTCMVDLFGRAGQLDKAAAAMAATPFSADPTLLQTFLGACQREGNTKLGRSAFECAAGMDENEVAALVSMSNIHAASGQEEDASGLKEDT